jgi:hypothetical protein
MTCPPRPQHSMNETHVAVAVVIESDDRDVVVEERIFTLTTLGVLYRHNTTSKCWLSIR